LVSKEEPTLEKWFEFGEVNLVKNAYKQSLVT
jgi:hypothetical protein